MGILGIKSITKATEYIEKYASTIIGIITANNERFSLLLVTDLTILYASLHIYVEFKAEFN